MGNYSFNSSCSCGGRRYVNTGRTGVSRSGPAPQSAAPTRNAGTCGCCPGITPTEACPGEVVAMAYVPWQLWEDTYDVERALARGTLFPALDKPFRGGGCA